MRESYYRTERRTNDWFALIRLPFAIYLLTLVLRSRLPSHSYSLFSSCPTAVRLEVVSESELEVTYKEMSN